MEIRVRLEWSKTTKNTYVYVAKEDAAIRTLYVQKDGMPGQDPPRRLSSPPRRTSNAS